MLEQLIIATDILHTNATIVDHAIAYAKWTAPGVALTAAMWTAHRVTRRVQARRHARAEAREAAQYAAEPTEDDEARMRRIANAIDTAPLIPTRPGPRDGTYHQLEALYRAPAARRHQQ